MKPVIKIFSDSSALVLAVAEAWAEGAEQAKKNNRNYNIVLSGGSTPISVYQFLLSSSLGNTIPWKSVHLFWGDERCVPVDDRESNFLMAKEFLLDGITLPEKNIHRIRGEDDAILEAARYSRHIQEYLHCVPGETPVFDWVLLGMGEDGHTASLFPERDTYVEVTKFCAVANHPQTGQRRISLTSEVFNQARKVTFIAKGKGKSEIIAQILGSEEVARHYPAGQIKPVSGCLEWLLDSDAASGLKNHPNS